MSSEDLLNSYSQTTWYMWERNDMPDEVKEAISGKTGRCVRSYTVTGAAVAEALTKALKLPESSRFFTAYFDPGRQAFVVLMEDDSFDAIPEGCKFPIDVVDFHTVPDIVNKNMRGPKVDFLDENGELTDG